MTSRTKPWVEGGDPPASDQRLSCAQLLRHLTHDVPFALPPSRIPPALDVRPDEFNERRRLEHDGVVPALLCSGKALAGGMPLSACLGTEETMKTWPASRGESLHTQTYLGHPAGCAAAAGERPADNNRLKRPEQTDQTKFPEPASRPLPADDVDGNSFHPLARSDRSVSVREGHWKLVVPYGQQTTYALFHVEDDPRQETDLSKRLEQITFRLRGLLEREEAQEFQREMGVGKPG